MLFRSVDVSGAGGAGRGGAVGVVPVARGQSRVEGRSSLLTPAARHQTGQLGANTGGGGGRGPAEHDADNILGMVMDKVLGT